MTTPYVTRYRNGEYLQYMKDVLELVNKQDVDTLLLTNQRNALTGIVSQIDNAFQQSLGSSLTQGIIELDDRRDKAFMGFKSVINGFSYHYDAAKKVHALNALSAIEKYGKDITRKSYQEETAIISSLITDFESQPELVTAVTELSLTDWLTELKTANIAFASKYLERVGDTAANPLANLVELRSQATVAYRVLISHIQAHQVLNTNAAYSIIIDEIDVLTKQYNLVVDNRTSSGTDSPIDLPIDDDITGEAV
ncbi:hypothetical protein EV195_104234 [Tenacibaculum skagerrakense]|uniref:Uncharacterized protein n=1 Tax=Tenacibaculum skagerrakense TaxID=186571 RepID=A0A4R2NUG2_9FLAO|nr:DUF6261 family protein [Tenacibaculum skagerrakense]TCP25201.1 hypothetical protein EV195_104234 [Tenacibaculum skagerrakense]